MRGAVAKEHRRTAARVAHQTIEALDQPIRAAINNEQLTRQRVETLEALLTRGLWGRLRWLLRGQ